MIVEGEGARLEFLPVGNPGARYPAWVRALDGKSGVYVIREYDDHERAWVIVYVGESHRGRLYGTLTRHWQRWVRGADDEYRHAEQSDHDPGLTYARARCEAAALITSSDRARDVQDALIRWLVPRDNILGADPVTEEAPIDVDDDDARAPYAHDDAVPF